MRIGQTRITLHCINFATVVYCIVLYIHVGLCVSVKNVFDANSEFQGEMMLLALYNREQQSTKFKKIVTSPFGD